MVSKPPTDYFSDREYLIGAYTPAPYLVPAYKKFCGQLSLFVGQVFFNDLPSSLHPNIEQAIGIWKSRFHFLRSININIASKMDMRHLIRLVKESTVLHNLFLGSNSVPKSWFTMEDLIILDFDDEMSSDKYLSSNLTG